MTPWHRFWFQRHDDGNAQSRDAALWTPQAITETQRALWQHAAQATEDWWRYWRSLWPSVPPLPPAGVVEPPRPAVGERPECEEAGEPPAKPARRRRVKAVRHDAAPAAAPGVTTAKRSRPVARGR